jgi:hypothetical protein
MGIVVAPVLLVIVFEVQIADLAFYRIDHER